jgi:hypothetical protein
VRRHPLPTSYYYCRRCGQGFFPFDQQTGIGSRRLTPAAEQLATLVGGVSDSFDKAQQLLHKMAGVRLSESTVERTTEAVGQRLAWLQELGVTFGPDRCWRWHRESKGRTVAYVTLGASGTRQQGPGGRHAEGRMAYVGGGYNPPPPAWRQPDGPAPPLQARYVSGLYALAAMGTLLPYQATAVGME